MLYRVIDIETTGVDATDHVVEIAACDVEHVCGIAKIVPVGSWLVRPPVPIPVVACAVHHITDDDVKDAPPWAEVLPKILSPDVSAYVAHQATFERLWLGELTPWICTYRAALRLWPEAPAHGTQALRYWRSYEGLEREHAQPPHRAAPDAYVTAHLLRDILQTPLLSFERLIEWTTQPALLAFIRFGKHEGKRFAELPPDYLQWLVNQGEQMDEDVRYTAKHYLAEIDRRRLEVRRQEQMAKWSQPS